MNSTSKLLAAIVHHVELHRDGWWDKAMQRLILASVWLADNNPSVDKIRTILESAFALSVSVAKVESVIKVLESQDFLIRLSNDEFRIPDSKQSVFEEEIASAENSGRVAKEFFFELVKELCNDLSPEEAWSKFESVFLAPLIREIGANAYKLIAGEEMTVNKKLVREFQEEFDSNIETQLLELISRFLDPKNEAVRSYISRTLHATFCVAASGLPDSVITKLRSSAGKRIRFRVFVDTNFLFSILNLHDNPSNSAATELKDLIDSLNSNLKIDLYVTPRTIDEAKRSISSAKYRLAGLPAGTNFAGAASHVRFSGLLARFLNEQADRSEELSVGDWFDPYLDNFVLLARDKGVKLYNEELDDYVVRQDVVDDIYTVLESEKDRGLRAKSFEMVQHDMVLWHLVNDNRPSYVESPVDAQDWILTLDFRFIGFDERKRKSQGASVPICVHPTSLIQLLQFWVPRTPEFEEAILGSMRLPFLFQDFDPEAERISLRILKRIGQFEGNEHISEESISQVMLNEELRARLGSEQNKDVEAKLIRDALVEEIQAQAEKEKNRAENLDTEVKARDSQILTLMSESAGKEKEIKKLQARVAAEKTEIALANSKLQEQDQKIEEISNRLNDSKIEQAKKGAFVKYSFLFAGVLLISVFGGWLAGKVQLLTKLIGTIPFQIIIGVFVFVLLHLIIEACVKRNEAFNQLWPFQQISRFRAWLWSSIILVLVLGIIGNIITNDVPNRIDEQVIPVEPAREEDVEK